MSLASTVHLTKDARRKKIHDELTAHFKGTYTTEEWMVWKEYLDEQDPKVLIQAVDQYIQHAGANSWVPSLKQISSIVNSIYNIRRAKDAEVRAASVCEECSGTAWNKVGPNTAYPCSKCLPEAFTRWRADRYLPFGYLKDGSELTGPAPDANYTPPTQPRIDTGTPISPERAKQYEDFMLHGNGFDSIDEYIAHKLEGRQHHE